jgi:hypothetical protein
MKQLKLMLLAATACASFSAGAANLIDNGSFELGGTAGYDTFASDYIKNGNIYDPSVLTIGTNPNAVHSSWATFGALDGANMLIVNGGLDASSGVFWSQTLNLSAGTYNFSAAAASTYPTNPSHVIAIATIDGTDVTLGEVQLGRSTQWATLTGGFLLQNSGSVTIKLKDLSTDYTGNDFAVDKISLTSAVPEPETYAMMLAGLGLVGFAARRRKA